VLTYLDVLVGVDERLVCVSQQRVSSHQELDLAVGLMQVEAASIAGVLGILRQHGLLIENPDLLQAVAKLRMSLLSGLALQL
jgi:hypothetical protein